MKTHGLKNCLIELERWDDSVVKILDKQAKGLGFGFPEYIHSQFWVVVGAHLLFPALKGGVRGPQRNLSRYIIGKILGLVERPCPQKNEEKELDLHRYMYLHSHVEACIWKGEENNVFLLFNTYASK